MGGKLHLQNKRMPNFTGCNNLLKTNCKLLVLMILVIAQNIWHTKVHYPQMFRLLLVWLI